MEKSKKKIVVPDGCIIKWVAYITQKDGTRLYAKQCGIRAFPLIVKAS